MAKKRDYSFLVVTLPFVFAAISRLWFWVSLGKVASQQSLLPFYQKLAFTSFMISSDEEDDSNELLDFFQHSRLVDFFSSVAGVILR